MAIQLNRMRALPRDQVQDWLSQSETQAFIADLGDTLSRKHLRVSDLAKDPGMTMEMVRLAAGARTGVEEIWDEINNLKVIRE